MITAHTTSCLQVIVATQTTARIHLPDTMDQVCLLLPSLNLASGRSTLLTSLSLSLQS